MTLYIVIFTALISISAFSNQNVMGKMLFNPYMVAKKNEWYRFISNGFIHADWLHLIINMFVLYSFGTQVEHTYSAVFGSMGTFYFIMLYVGGLIIAVAPTYKKNKENPYYNSLGASGAVSGIVFAYILFYPWQKIYLYALIGIPAVLAGIAYLAYSQYMNKKGGDNVNHDAHFWGAVYGFLFTMVLKPSLFSYFFQQLLNPQF
ncbi:MAG TPA: rhomboid family intramembrane serine protease [Bacteroidia bacterium]|nr:rhomboid family intramembrane serine protease [Bacteroidia bacterium]